MFGCFFGHDWDYRHDQKQRECRRCKKTQKWSWVCNGITIYDPPDGYEWVTVREDIKRCSICGHDGRGGNCHECGAPYSKESRPIQEGFVKKGGTNPPPEPGREPPVPASRVPPSQREESP